MSCSTSSRWHWNAPISSPTQPRGSRWPALVGIAVSLGFLAWALRGVDAAGLLREIRGAHLAPLALAVGVATCAFPIRLVRWRLLLRADDGAALPVLLLWHAVAMGFMANNVFPLRAGELLRCYAAARLTGTRLAPALSSVAVERVFDALTVVGLLAIALFTTHLPPAITIAGTPVSVARLTFTGGLVSLAALVAASAVVAWPLAAEAVVRRVVPSDRIAGTLVRLIEGVRHGLATLRSPGRLAGVIAWSIVLWVVNAAAFWIAFAAFDLPVDFAGAVLLQGLLMFAIAVPSTPGFIGVFEAVIKAVLLLYGVSATRGTAYALVYHVTTFIPITLLGLWSLARADFTLADARRPLPS